MKKNILSRFVFLVIVASSLISEAKSVSDNSVSQFNSSAKNISKLSYLPSVGEFFLKGSVRNSKINSKVKTSGITLLDADTDVKTIDASLVVGVFEDLVVGAKMPYLLSSDLSYTTPISPATKQQGYKEPVFEAEYRLFTLEMFLFDIRGTFQPSLGEAKSATSNTTGDGLNGGHAFEVGGRGIVLLGESFELFGDVVYKSNGVQSSYNPDTNVSSEDSAHGQITFSLGGQLQVVESLFLGADLEIVNVDGYKSKNLTTNSTTEYGSTSATALNANAKYEFTQDQAIAGGFGYILNYSGDVQGYAVEATGYNLELGYAIRF